MNFESFAESDIGLLYMANGFDDVMVWDGLAPQMQAAGLDAPAAGVTVAGTGGGSITGDYTAYLRYVDRFGFYSNLSPISTEVSLDSVGTVTYTSVEVPTDHRVVRRQILRNTTGQTETYYVDVDTTDLSATTFSSTKTDDELAAEESQAILDEDGGIFANANTPPVNHKPYMVFHLSRMFYAGQRDYKEGMVQVTTGSTTVTGIGTEWVSGLEGRYLYVIGAPESYLISSVDTTNQTLTLSTGYDGDTDLFASYSIRPAPAERRTIYYSEASLPGSVPATNGLTIPETGDEIVGLMVRGSWVYVIEKRNLWKITFADSIPEDLGLFKAADRGCVNNRCWVKVDDRAYMLDEQGVHVFGGEPMDGQISQPIQDIFRPEGETPWRIDWNHMDLFHAIHYRPQETIRWFVTMSGSQWPRHALCFQYRLKRFWVEEFPFDVSGSCPGRYKETPRNYLGSEAEKIFSMNEGYVDVADASAGTVRGTATSTGILSLADSSATYDSSVVNAPITLIDGRGRGQTRRIVSYSGTTLTIDRPWNILPDTTSQYQIGGVNWRFKTSWFRYAGNEEMADRRFEVIYEPMENASTARMRIYHDFADESDEQAIAWTNDAGGGVKVEKGGDDLILDLTKETGVLQARYPGHREYFLRGRRFVQLELSGASNDESTRIYQVTMEGVGNPTAIGEN